MEPNPESRPSVKEQMENMFRLRDKLSREFTHACVAGGIAGLSFVVLTQITFPIAAPERYVQVASALGQFHEPINWALLSAGFIGSGVGFIKMIRMGSIIGRMNGIQEDLRSREQEGS